MIRELEQLAQQAWAVVLNRVSVAISGFYITASAVAEPTVTQTAPSGGFVSSAMTAGSCIVILLNIVIMSPKAYSRGKRMWYCATGRLPKRRATDIPASPSDINELK